MAHSTTPDGGPPHARWRCKCDDCRDFRAAREKERIARLRERPIADDKHGVVGYTFWQCRCSTCVEAQREAMRRGKSSRTARPEDIPHGTRSGYEHWACRCRACAAAASVYQAPRLLASQDQAVNRGKEWTGPELEVADRRDLSAREIAGRLGRSISAVAMARYEMRRDPRKAALLGAGRRRGTVHSLPIRGTG